MLNIVEVVVADKSLATLFKSFKAVQLETELSKAGPFTIFAPTDRAFGKLAAGKMAELLKPENKVKLTDLLNHHVVKGKTSFKDLVDGQKLQTLHGQELTVQVKNGAVSINGSRIQGRETEASNGVVHSLDEVIMSN
jgi:uncharacterized surface protein with fasciclin (FAS1) repeats